MFFASLRLCAVAGVEHRKLLVRATYRPSCCDKVALRIKLYAQRGHSPTQANLLLGQFAHLPSHWLPIHHNQRGIASAAAFAQTLSQATAQAIDRSESECYTIQSWAAVHSSWRILFYHV
jgi:hypothetical protein